MSTVHLTAAYTLLVATVHLYFTLYTCTLVLFAALEPVNKR